jgi:endoglycosylceramidase
VQTTDEERKFNDMSAHVRTCDCSPAAVGRGRRWLGVAAALLAILLLAAPGAASGSPALPLSHAGLPLSHAGRWLTDTQGRVVIVHGINMVYKRSPYYPAAVGFGEDDAAFLQRIGFNAVRVGVIWKAVEPEPGVYDEAYLEQIAKTVHTLAARGIVSLLDFHQDLFNERFQGEGAPDWAVQDEGLPNPSNGFPLNYVTNAALQKSFDNFWANSEGPGGIGLLDRFAAAWRHVAAHFAGQERGDSLGTPGSNQRRGDSSVAAYELFNEPFRGTNGIDCISPSGCPEFDAKLTAFNHKVAAAIREVDPSTMIFYEPNVGFNFGYNTSVGSLGDAHAGFAFHDYCLNFGPQPQGCKSEATAIQNASDHVAKTHEALMLTEFGSTTSEGDLTRMVALADRARVPWLEWSYCPCNDPTGSTPDPLVLDPSQPPSGSNLGPLALRTLVEPYPQLVAGVPQAWAFDRSTGTFTLTYTTGRAGGGRRFAAGSITEIATPPLVYPHGYIATVAGGAVVSRADAGTLEVTANSGIRTVSLTVTPRP